MHLCVCVVYALVRLRVCVAGGGRAACAPAPPLHLRCVLGGVPPFVWVGQSRVYVGNLPPDVRTRELEDLFLRFGRIRDISIKAPRGPGNP